MNLLERWHLLVVACTLRRKVEVALLAGGSCTRHDGGDNRRTEAAVGLKD